MKQYLIYGMMSLFCVTTVMASDTDMGLIYPNWINPLQVEASTVVTGGTMYSGEPVLLALIERALENNVELLALSARLEQAKGVRRQKGSAILPSLDLTAKNYESDLVGADQARYTEAGIEISYDVDIFGVNRNAKRAAIRGVDAATYDYRSYVTFLTSELAKAYASLRADEMSVVLIQKNLKTLTETLRIIETQKLAGEANQLDVERAKSLYYATEARLYSAKRRAQENKLLLSTLVGQSPYDLVSVLNKPGAIPVLSLFPVIESPLQIIKNRSDVKGALARLLATEAFEKSVKASWFPTISLGGFYGMSDGDTFADGEAWSMTAAARFSLIDFGDKEGQIDSASGETKRVRSQYKKVVLAALIEIESALNQVKFLTQELATLARSKNSADEALRLSLSLYNEGEIAFLDILDAERTVINADQLVVNATLARTQAIIGLYKGLRLD
jgi:NodT family efflux transporter outer membrane factor (OMF) lipoprotein